MQILNTRANKEDVAFSGVNCILNQQSMIDNNCIFENLDRSRFYLHTRSFERRGKFIRGFIPFSIQSIYLGKNL